MNLTPATKLRAREAPWSDELVARFEASPLKDYQVMNLLALHITEERAGRYLGIIESNPEQSFLQFSELGAADHGVGD